MIRQTILLMILLFPVMAMAAPLPAELTRALNRLAAAHGLSSQFEQTIRFSDGTMQHYRGEVDVLTPGRFRWRYIEPYEQLFVSDGHTIWHYEPDLMQVQVLKTMQGVDPVLIRLLDGSLRLNNVLLLESENKAGGLMHRYHVRVGGEKEVWLGLSSKNGKNGDSLLSSGRKSETVPVLTYVESVDALGNYNRIRLLHTEDPPAPTAFVFRIPAGADVLPLK